MARWVTLLVALLVSSIAAAEMPPIPRGQGEYCVEPTDIMRKQHMDFLLHQRDRTVYEGIRTKQHSLNNCVDCHVQTNAEEEFIPIDAPGQFCEVCHTFASVKLDCFECHATKPDGPSTHAATGSGTGFKSVPLFAQSFRTQSGLETGADLKSVPTYHHGSDFKSDPNYSSD